MDAKIAGNRTDEWERKMSSKINSTIKTYVIFYYPGALFAEDETKEVESFDPLTLDVPEGVYAFQSYKVEILTTAVDGVEFTKTKPPFDKSKMYYPDGEILSLDYIAEQYGTDDTLYWNVKANGYQYAVKTRRGNFQFFDPENDTILVTDLPNE